MLFRSLIVLPLGYAFAQDFEAVEKRLAKGVVKGELSLQQAADMMELLHENAGDDDGADDEDFRAEMKEELEEVGAELREAVMRGEMSEKEAWGAWYAFKKNEFGPQLKEAVRDGVLSEKEAWMWWIGVKKAEQAQRLKDAVMKGEMSEEDARKKWMQMEQGHRMHHRGGYPHHKQHGKQGHHSDRKGHWGHGGYSLFTYTYWKS